MADGAPAPQAGGTSAPKAGRKQKPAKPAKPAKPHKRRRLWIVIVSIVVALALVGGGGFYWWQQQNSSPDAGPQVAAELPAGTPTLPAPPAPDALWPLTGIPMAADASSGPSLCIKIENAKAARPQLGIDHADIMFEEVVEGGITRYMAVFQSDIPKQVEPVRSLRPMDPPLAKQFGCALVFSGGQAPFVSAAKSSGLTLIYQDHGDKGFSRDKKRSAPHNVVGDMATFMSAANKAKLTPPQQAFAYPDLGQASSIVAGGQPVSRINITMSSVSKPHWVWNSTRSVWLRYDDDKTKSTVVGGTQLYATNVLTLSVALVNTQYKDPAHNPVPETQIVGSGTGTFSAAGKSMPIHWSKASASQPIVLTDAAGNPVTLVPGNTWVELVPKTGSVKTVA